MTRLTIVMEIPDVDPLREDPEDIAQGLIDWDGFPVNGKPSPDMVAAQWGDMLPEADED